MLLLFVVEFADGTVQRCPVSCDENRPFSVGVSYLRNRLNLGHSAKLDFRLSNGAPLDVNKTVKQLPLETNASVFVIADSQPGGKEGKRSKHAERTPSPQRGTVSTSVTRLGPQEDATATGTETNEDTDEDATSECTISTLVSEAAGIHSFQRDGHYWKSFVKKPVSFLEKILREEPIVSVAYAMQLVQTVKGNDKLRTRTYDPNAEITATSVSGLDDATFTRYLSIAKTHGRVLQTEDRFKTQIGFYPQVLCIRHSCSPNAVCSYQSKPPYDAVVRCCALEGLDEGEEVTILYPAVDTLGFLLLPRERRHTYLQRKYHFTCRCSRCRSDDNPNEQTLCGAFFHVSSPADQRAASEKMREQFSQLNLLDDNTGLPSKDLSKGDAGRLCQFLLDYSGPDARLQLHPNHWRLSLVRIAYMWHLAGGTLDRHCFDFALQQLQTEAKFIPIGHPLSLITYRRFKLMVSRLPSRLAGIIQRKGLDTPGIPWDVLQQLDSTFGSHHNTHSDEAGHRR
jgi:hypothetical protein